MLSAMATHPLKKGLVLKINIRLLTLLFGVIYQAGHDLWCPLNDGWENFAQLQIFPVKQGKMAKFWGPYI